MRIMNPYRFEASVPAGPAPHWDIWILGNQGDEITVAELEFAAAPGGPDLCSGGTPIGEFNTTSLTDAFDNNPSTRTTFSRAFGARLGYAFASPVEVGAVRMTCRNDGFPSQAPTAFIVRRSLDGGATWQGVGIFAIPNAAAWTNGEVKEWAVSENLLPDSRNQARLWLLRVATRGDGTTNMPLRIGELEMATSLGGSNIALGAAPLTYRADNNYHARKMFDGSNGYASNYHHTENGWPAPWIIGACFEAPVAVAQIRAQSHNSPDSHLDSLGAFTIEWSSDGVNFHVTDSIADAGFTSTNQWREFSVSP